MGIYIHVQVQACRVDSKCCLVSSTAFIVTLQSPTVFSIYARHPSEASHCVTRILYHDIGSEAPQRVALGCRHSTDRLGLLAASHIVRL